MRWRRGRYFLRYEDLRKQCRLGRGVGPFGHVFGIAVGGVDAVVVQMITWTGCSTNLPVSPRGTARVHQDRSAGGFRRVGPLQCKRGGAVYCVVWAEALDDGNGASAQPA